MTTIDVPAMSVGDAKKDVRTGRGTFAKGNKLGRGRPPGTFARVYEDVRKWGTKDKVIEVLEKMRVLALSGDVPAAKVLLDKILPDRMIIQHEGRLEHAHAHVHYVLPNGVVPIEEPARIEDLSDLAEVIT